MNILNRQSKAILNRNIRTHGIYVEFKRPELNEYSEVSDDYTSIGIKQCLYHSAHNHEALNQSDAGKTIPSQSEMLLTDFTDDIKFGDVCEINGVKYVVSDIVNFNQSNDFLDIKLERIRDGNIT